MNYFIRQDSIYIGDVVNYIIELDIISGQVPIFPDIKADSESMSIVGKRVGEKFVEYDLIFWETGIGKIPKIPTRRILY